MLNDRFEKLKEVKIKSELELKSLQKRREDLVADMDSTRIRIQTLVKVEELYKHLLDKYVNQYAESFSSIVTEGLENIFFDQDISFNVVVGQKGGKVWLDFETHQNGVKGPALEAFGGGVACVESFLLRLLVLLKTGLAKYLILDESFAALSVEYVEDAGRFIRKMCEDLDVHILLVTHNPEFLNHAHRAYKGDVDKTGGSDRLCIKELNLK
jgi:hypothetical protein